MDAAGNAYVAGETRSTIFPTTPGGFQTTSGGSIDAFVTKLNSIGSALVYSTYLAGNGDDEGFGIAVDAAGSAYVTGSTYSTNFPTTAGAFQTTPGGGVDAFVAKITDIGLAAGQPTNLGALVSSFDLHRGTENSLLSKLGDALAAINAGEVGTACGSLGAFLNEVQAQTEKKITAAQAAELVAGATQITTVLGCP